MLVKTFYERVPEDDLIGDFFTKVVVLDLAIHLPKIVAFWSAILLDIQGYKGNPMLKHIELSQKKKLEEKHFDRWLSIWNHTVDELFSGTTASLAKEKAHQIAGLMVYKIEKGDKLIL